MKTAGFILGGTMIALGLMAIAGSAGDCDGKCGITRIKSFQKRSFKNK